MNSQELSQTDLGNRHVVQIDPPHAAARIQSHVQKTQHWPFVIPLLVFVQLCVAQFQSTWTWLSLCYDPYRRHELWRYLTILLIHFSPVHLLGNMLFELILGLPLEMSQGGLRTGAIFLSGVIGGSLCISVLERRYYAVGASGGVYALLAAHVVQFLLNWNQMKRKFLRLHCLIAYIIFDVGAAFYRPVPNVSHAAHFGGAIGGFIAAAFLVGNLDNPKCEKPFKRLVGWIGIILICIVLIINTTAPTLYNQTEFHFNYLKTFLESELNNTVPENPAFWEFLCTGCTEFFERRMTMHWNGSLNH